MLNFAVATRAYQNSSMGYENWFCIISIKFDDKEKWSCNLQVIGFMPEKENFGGYINTYSFF